MPSADLIHTLSSLLITILISTTTQHFQPRHIPNILIAAGTATGGTWPIFSPSSALTEFGFTKQIAASKPAWPVITAFSARDTTIGVSILALYVKGHLEAVDVIWSVVSYIAFMDYFILRTHGREGQGVFRFVAVGLSAAVGLTRLTSGVSPVGLGVWG